MNNDLQKKFQNKLEADKKKLINELKFFAKKDPQLKGNWLTRFPFFNLSRSHRDENAEEIEEYENLLPVEHTLELRLKDIEDALVKIKKGAYGQCEECKKRIEIKRLEVIPEAKLCLKCGKEKNFR